MKYWASFFNILFLAIATQLLFSCASKNLVNEKQYLCSHIYIYAPEEIELNDVERRLICGDKESIAYKEIPLYQAKIALEGFLQNLGYINSQINLKGNTIEIYSNEKIAVKHIDLKGKELDQVPAEYQENILDDLSDKYKSYTITPGVLNQIEAYAKADFRNNSYACVDVKSNGIVDESRVILNLNHLKSYNFGIVDRASVEGIRPEAFERFYPFEPEEKFKAYKLTLTEKRFLREGVVQGTYFNESCAQDEFTLTQSFITGAPRVIRLGIGANTEVGPILRAKWSNQRYGSMASLLSASLELSFRNQTLNLTSNHFHWPSIPRLSLRSTLDIYRDDQTNYVEETLKLRPHLEYRLDTEKRLWTMRFGPTFIWSNYSTKNDQQPEQTIRTGAIEGMVNLKSHLYELYDTHPQIGDNTTLAFDFRHPKFGFSDPLLRLELTTLKLWNVGNIGRGEGIIGAKIISGTTFVHDRVLIDSLEPSVRFYGGSSEDIRGFKLNSLPLNNGLGALSKLVFKLEFRKTHFIRADLETFVFTDAGRFGYKSFELDERTFISPGVGLRWLSPIGPVQGYYSRAFVNKSDIAADNFFFLGLGGGF